MPEGRGGSMTGRPGMMMEAPDPIVLSGPPGPDSLAVLLLLNASQRERYAALYERFSATTQPQRDSLRTEAEAMREAFRSRDRSAARQHGDRMRTLREGLERRQKAFDESLKELLNREQWKKYEQWREQERKAVAERRRGFRPGGGRPPQGAPRL